MNAMSDVQCKFRDIGREFFGPSFKQILKIRLRENLPRLYTFLGYILPRDETTTFFTNVVLDMIKYRKTNDIYRPDFINALINIQNHPEKLDIGGCSIFDNIRIELN